jgi:hypothetical protein
LHRRAAENRKQADALLLGRVTVAAAGAGGGEA